MVTIVIRGTLMDLMSTKITQKDRLRHKHTHSERQTLKGPLF